MPARATKPQPRPKQPTVVVIAGPNGAGKSTAAPYLLKDALGILEFVNADQIAAGLSAYAPETVAFEAGRIMLQRLRTLAAAKVSFAFETTLSSRTFALFLDAHPDAGGKDFIESLNPNSLKVVTAIVEPSLANAKPDDKFQFERHGYFVADRVDHAAEKPVFNLAVGLKDSWGK